MKKLFVILEILLVASFVIGADLAAVSGNRSDRVRAELQTGWNALVAGTSSLAECLIDGKWAITGVDATTGMMVQAGAITSTGTLETNTFPVAFGAAPIVTCVYTEDPGDVRPIFVGTITATTWIVNVASSKNYAYTAVGARP